jgi:metallo-beta-lactamase class B
MRAWKLALLFAATFAAGCYAQAPVPLPETKPEWLRSVAPFRLIGNVHFVGTAGLGSYLITDPRGHILIDGGLPENAPQIARNIVQLGYHLQDVKYLLINHAHYDHAGGLAELKRLTGAQLVASSGDRPELESGKVSYRSTPSWPGAKVDEVVGDGATLILGQTRLVAHMTPGHTRGCTSWSTEASEQGKRFTIIFACSLTVAGQPLVGSTGYPDAAADFERTFATLHALHEDVFLNFHTEFFDLEGKRKRLEAGDALAFVDPAELDRQVSDAEKAFREQLAKERVAAGQAGNQ